jgi:hypothetical protein
VPLALYLPRLLAIGFPLARSALTLPLERRSTLTVFPFFLLTSNRVGLPAELKHINKRRKRN